MPTQHETDLLTVGDFIEQEGSPSLDNMHVYLEVDTSNYHDIGRGIRDVFVIQEQDEEYIAKDHEGKVIVETEADKIVVRQVSTNPYERDYLEEFELNNLDKKEEFLQAVTMLAHKRVSFGGEKPYIRLLRKVFIGVAPSKPIGDAVIGDTLVIQ